MTINFSASPFDDGAGPGQATAEYNHQNVIAVFDPAAAICFIQGDRDRRGRSIPVFVEVHVETFQRDFQSVGDCLDDPQISLMRDDARDVVRSEPRIGQDFSGGVDHRGDGLLVNFFAGHVNRRQIHIDIVARDRAARAAAGHEQNLSELSIAADVGANDTMRAAAVTQHRRASAIAEQHASVSIRPVRDRS